MFNIGQFLSAVVPSRVNIILNEFSFSQLYCCTISCVVGGCSAAMECFKCCLSEKKCTNLTCHKGIKTAVDIYLLQNCYHVILD